MAEVNTTTEIWKPVVGFEELYSISNYGNLRRHRRRDTLGRRTKRGEEIKVHPHCKQGYLIVSLRDKTGKTKTLKIHQIVAHAFLGPQLEGHQVNHKDGFRTNNRVSNLEYVTPRENAQHAIRIGLWPFGDKHWSRRSPDLVRRGEQVGKLNDWQVRVIRRLLSTMTASVIASFFGVHRRTIQDIKTGKSWRHIN